MDGWMLRWMRLSTYHFPSFLDHVTGLQEVLAGHGDVLIVFVVIIIVVVTVLQVPRVLMTSATCAQSGAPDKGEEGENVRVCINKSLMDTSPLTRRIGLTAPRYA